MPVFQISVINKDFDATEDVTAQDQEGARTHALKGALEIGSEEVLAGKPFFGAEIRIDRDAKIVERLLVSVGVSPLRL